MKWNDRIVCTSAGRWGVSVDLDGKLFTKHPEKDEIYRIKTVWSYDDGLDGLELYGFEGRTYDSRSFRPVDESFGPSVCSRIEEEILDDEMREEIEPLFI